MIGHLAKGTTVKGKYLCKSSSGSHWVCYKSCAYDDDLALTGRFVYQGNLRRV
ncbi:hypothetical protein [Streptomyces flavofungini]|uniref:hypothetical protein n=1 Tax=Streptomyces flavofungini TaxID=68200 RepID=UPI0034DEE8FD